MSWIRGWSYWQLEAKVRAWVGSVVAVAVLGVALGGSTPSRLGIGLGVFCAIAGMLQVEVQKRLNDQQASEQQTNLHALWIGTATLAGHPWMGLLTAAVLYGAYQLRIQKTAGTRSVFSAACSVAGFTVAWHLGDHIDPLLNQVGLGDLHYLVLAGIGLGVMDVLVGMLMKLRLDEFCWKEFFGRDELMVEASEVIMIALVVAAWHQHPVLAVLATVPAAMLQRALCEKETRQRAQRDAKTGLLSIAAWREQTEAVLERCADDTGVLVVDLDHFKKVNDTYGHLAGDQVLAAAARALMGAVRPGDLCGRFGGEELVVFLTRVDRIEAQRVAERVRAAVEGTSVNVRGVVVSVTASVGVGVGGTDLEDLLGLADDAVYRAKGLGRNLVA